jgi:hypothetical protein
MKAAMERHPAMICQIYTDSCLTCHCGTVWNPQSFWRSKGTCASSAFRHRQLTPDATRSSPRILPAIPGLIQGIERLQPDNVPGWNLDSHVPLPITDLAIMMHYLGIAYTMKILIQNCWLMKGHHLVSKLSAVSECWEHTFWRRQQPI